MQNQDRRVQRGPQGELFIYPARQRLIRLAILGLIMTLVGIWVLTVFEGNSYISGRILIKTMGTIGVILFGSATIWFLIRAFSRKPLLILSDDGVLNRESVYRLPLVRWSEIEGVEIGEEMGHPHLWFRLRDSEAVIRRCRSSVSRTFHGNNLKKGRPVMTVSQNHAGIPLDELRQEVERRLQAHHGT